MTEAEDRRHRDDSSRAPAKVSVGIASTDPGPTRALLEGFCSALSAACQLKVTAVGVSHYNRLLEAVDRGEVDVAWLPPIVFVTAHVEHASKAFDLDACDYVLKPVSKERIQRALARVLRRVRIDETEQAVPRLRVTHAKGSHFVEVRRIEAFRAVEKYVAFDVDGEEHLLRESLDDLETRFASAGFVRAHRAHLIRTAAVIRTEDAEQGLVLVMQSGLRIPVSKRVRSSPSCGIVTPL